MAEHVMKPIWFFVGSILLTMGCVIFLSGVNDLIYPPLITTRLAHLHPAIWWGAIMAACGTVMFMKPRKGTA